MEKGVVSVNQLMMKMTEQGESQMDIDEGSETIQPGKSLIDFSIVTQRREQNIANIKLHYEDQLENLRS